MTGPLVAPGRWPGIVLEWRQSEGRWQGRVVVVVLKGLDPQVVCAWFDQDDLAPADWSGHDGDAERSRTAGPGRTRP